MEHFLPRTKIYFHDVYQNMVPPLCSTSVSWKSLNIVRRGREYNTQVTLSCGPALLGTPHAWVSRCLVERSGGTAPRGSQLSRVGNAAFWPGVGTHPRAAASTPQCQYKSDKAHAVVITGKLCSAL